MKNNQTTTEATREKIFMILFEKWLEHDDARMATDEIMQVIQQEKKAVAEEILVFLDDLEMRQPDELKTDNWRNWKYIRNSIVDKYKLAHSQEDREGKE